VIHRLVVTNFPEAQMAHKFFIRHFGMLGLALFLTLPALAQKVLPKPNDREVDRVQAMVTQAKKEAEQFLKLVANQTTRTIRT
jgi:hypothetical protein